MFTLLVYTTELKISDHKDLYPESGESLTSTDHRTGIAKIKPK
jgi:hypothetical protein